MLESLGEHGLWPGKRVAERYEVLRAHRQGGLAVAFAARDLERGDECELQLFPESLFDGGDQALSFARSFEPWCLVRSDHVLGVREVAQAEGGSPVLVTDLPEGTSLRALIDAGATFEGADVIELGLEILSGLEAVHAAGLVHGDVKPRTCFLPARRLRGLVLVDGGQTPGLWSAKDLGERTALIGTPYYAPVEQFGGDAPDVLTDVYNVATLLFELVTGVQPWAGKSFLEVFQSKLAKEPPRMAARAPGVRCDPKLEAVVRTGMAAERAQRHPSAAAFREQLAACAG